MTTPASAIPPKRRRPMGTTLLTVAGLLAVIIGVSGFLYFNAEETRLREGVFQELGAIADLKVQQVSNWRTERRQDGEFLMKAPFVARDITALLASPEATGVRSEVYRWLELMKGGERYELAAVFDPSGRPLVSVPVGAAERVPNIQTQIAATLQGNNVVITDISLEPDGLSHLAVLTPVFPPEVAGPPPVGTRRPIAVVMLRLDPRVFLFPLVRRWPTRSESAETFLVRREGDTVAFLTPLRAGTAKRLSIMSPDLPSAMAVRNENGVREGVDYRGERVLAAVRQVPDSPWRLVAKIDHAEAYARIHRAAWRTVGVVAGLLAVLGVAIVFLWRVENERVLARALEAERERKALADRLARVMHQANDIFLLLGTDGRILEANDRALATYGYSLAELRARSLAGLRAPTVPSGADADPAQLRSADGVIFQTIHQAKDGTLIPVEVSGRVVNTDGAQQALVVIRDVSQRIAHEQEIERLNCLYATLSQINQVIVRVTSRDELFREVCRNVVEFGRFKMAWIGWLELETETVRPLAQWGDTHGYLDKVNVGASERADGNGPTGTAIRTGKACICTDLARDPAMTPWRDAARAEGFAASAAFPIRQAGVVCGALSIYAAEAGYFREKEIAVLEEAASDISFALDFLAAADQRRRAELALRDSEQRYRWLFANMAEGYAFCRLVSRDGRPQDFVFLAVNDAFAGLTGLGDVTGRPASGVIPGIRDSDPELFDVFGRVVQTGLPERFETLVRSLGMWFSFSIYRPEPGHFIAVFDIITERKRAETALRASEERFRQMAENVDEVFWMRDPIAGTFLYVSPAYERIWGRSTDELYRDAEAWLRTVHPLDRTRVEAAFRRVAEREYRDEYRIVRRDNAVRWIAHRSFPVRNAENRTFRMVGVAEDITDRKTMEQRFLRAQRLENLGLLAGGIAHDLNNILAPIMMAAPLLRMELTPAQIAKCLGTIEASAQRGTNLVRQLLIFGRGVEGEHQPIRVKDLVREILDMIRETFPRSISAETNLASDLWMIVGDATQFHQVLLNLCVNARDAMPKGGTLTLGAENVRLNEAQAREQGDIRPGDYVRLTVADTGIGMPPEIIDRIFDPFFTTKAAGEGTGLGLSTTLGIVKSHGGFLSVRSEVGKGTTFAALLPAMSEASVETPAPPPPTAFPQGSGEVVLIVDDEQNVREVIGAMLRRAGYDVVAAADGAEGASAFARQPGKIHVVLTDIDMPVMGGVDMIRALRLIDPAVRVVVTTGLGGGIGNDNRLEQLAELGVTAILDKPFTVDQVLSAVNQALTEAKLKAEQ